MAIATERTYLQDTFLNHVRDQKTPLTVFLVNGVKLTGVVASFDNFSIELARDGFSQLIYKHAISTIMPVSPIKLDDEPAKVPSDRDRRPM
jgi:host factor-I protein